MTRTMYDSTTVSDIPTSCQLAAVYRNGAYAASPADVAKRFPASKYVTVWIDVNGTHAASAQVLDVENGDATPGQAAGWIKARREAQPGALPTVYCNRSTQPAVESACTAAGLHLGTDWWLWVSTLDGTTVTGSGIVACQDKGTGQTGGHYDSSVVYADWWHCLAAARTGPGKAQAESALATLTAYVAES